MFTAPRHHPIYCCAIFPYSLKTFHFFSLVFYLRCYFLREFVFVGLSTYVVGDAHSAFKILMIITQGLHKHFSSWRKYDLRSVHKLWKPVATMHELARIYFRLFTLELELFRSGWSITAEAGAKNLFQQECAKYVLKCSLCDCPHTTYSTDSDDKCFLCVRLHYLFFIFKSLYTVTCTLFHGPI